MPRQILSRMITAAAAIFTAHHASSQDTFTWDGGGADGNWQASPLNWAGNIAPDGADILNFSGGVNLNTNNDFAAYNGYRIIFTAGAGNFTLGGNALTLSDFAGSAPIIDNLSVGSTQTINLGLTFNGTGATFAEINPTQGNLIVNGTVDLAGTTQLRVRGDNGNTLTFNNVISSSGGANSFALNGSSTVVFNGANTYGGNTFVNAGTLRINDTGSVATGSTIVIGDTAGVADANVEINSPLGGKVTANAIQFRPGSGGARILASTNTVGTNTFSGSMAFDAFGTLSTTAGGVVSVTGPVGINNGSFVDVSGAGHAIISGNIGENSLGGFLYKNNTGTLVLGGANTHTGGTEATAGRIILASAGGLGGAVAATNGTVTVDAGAQVLFSGFSLTNSGKNFLVSGAGPDGRGALLNDYNAGDANKLINSLVMVGDTTIGGTNQLDIGSNAGATQFLEGNGAILTVATRSRFNIRGQVTNLPNIVLNSGNVEIEGVDVGVGSNGAAGITTVTVNGPKSTMGAHTGSGTRTWAGDIILNNGANLGGIGGTATNFLIVGSAGKTLTINGEGRLNANTAGYIDWSGIAGVSNLRVDSTVAGSGTMVINQFGGAANGNTVTLTQNNPGFSGKIMVGGGATASTLVLGTGTSTGDLGTSPQIEFGATSVGVPSVLTINRNNALTLNTALKGDGSLNINGGAIVTLNGANTTAGAGVAAVTTNVNQGTLILGGANVLSPRSNLQVGAGTPTTGQVRLNGFSPTVERLDDAGTVASVNNRIFNGSPTPAMLTFNITNAGPVFGDFAGQLGHITATADENNFGITKLGTSDWTLTGNTHGYTGLTIVRAGRFRLGANATFGNAVLGATGSVSNGTIVEPGGSLDFQGVAGYTTGAGNEVLTISGRGNAYTGNGFENGALVNNGTVNAVGANNVILAGDASIGKNGNTIVAGTDWDIRNTGSTAVLSMNGFTLTKVGRNTVNLADISGGVGNGNIVVRQGTLAFERNTVVGGTGTIRVLSGANVALNDNTGPVSVTKSIVLNGSELTNVNGTHNISQGLTTNGDFRAYNNDAAATLTLGNIVQPVRGAGGQFGTTGSVVLTTINGAAPAAGLLGGGWTAGTSPNTTTFATWNGTNVQPITLTFNTTASAISTATPTTDVLNNLTPNGPNAQVTADLTIGSLTSERDLAVNNGTLLRINSGGVVLRTNNHNLLHNAGTVGRITSGAADGELNFTVPVQYETAGGQSGLRLKIVDNPGVAGSFTPVTFVKNGPGGLNNWGMDAGGTSAPLNSDYTGGTIVDSSRMEVTSATGFGTGTITIRDGGTVSQIGGAGNGTNLFNKVNIAGSGAYENAGILGAIRYQNGIYTTVFSGDTTLQGDTRLHTQNAGDFGTHAGIIRGAFNVDKTGPGSLQLTSANVYTGSTTVTNGAMVVNRLENGGVASSIGASSNAASNLVLNGGTLRYVGTGTTNDRNFTLDIQGGGIASDYHLGALVINGAATLAAGADRTLTLSGINTNDNVFATALTDSTGGRTSLTKTNFGTWRLTGNNTIGGSVTVNGASPGGGGQLIVGDGGTNGTLGNGPLVTLADGADLVSMRSDNVVWNQRVQGAITGTTTTLPSALTEIVQRGTGTLTVGGYEDNASASVRVDSGTLVLAKMSNESVHASFGSTIVNGGTLRLDGTGNDQIHNGATGSNSTLFVNGGTFDMNGRYEAVQRIEGSGGVVTNSAPGTTSELVLGTGSSIAAATPLAGSSFFFRGKDAGYGGVIEDGAGTMRLSKHGVGLALLRGDNTYSGPTEILQGTLQLGKQGTTGSIGSGAIFLGAGDGSSVGTLLVDRKGTLTMNQVISGPGNVSMFGEGELRLTAANSWLGTTTVRRGTLTAVLAAQNDTLPVFANYNLEGGTLKIVGAATGTSSQTLAPAGVTVSGFAGFGIAGSNIVGDNNGGNLIVGLPNTWTRNVGGSVDFSSTGAGTTTFRTGVPNINGIIAGTNSAYATVGGTTWAVQSNGAITGLGAAGYNTAAGHLDLGAGVTSSPGGVIGRTVRFNALGAATVNLNGLTSTLDQGGVLVTPGVGANTVDITNGTIATTGNELLVHQHNTAGDLNISGVIGGSQAVTKAGNGKLILSGVNTATGGLFINQGTVQIGNGAAGNWAGSVTNDGTLIVNRNNGDFGATVTGLTTVVSGSGNVVIQGGANGVIGLTGANTYTGTTTVSSGYLRQYTNGSNQIAPIILGDANTGSNPVGVLSSVGAVATAITINAPITVTNQGTGLAVIGSFGGTVAAGILFNGAVELNRPTTFTSYATDRTTFQSVISGNVGTLTIGIPVLPAGSTLAAIAANARRVTFEQDNTFVGNVEVRDGSVLQIGTGVNGLSRDQIPDASNISLFGTGATLQFNYDGEVINNLNGDVGTLVQSIATGGAQMVLSVKGGTFDGTYNGGANGGMYLEKTGNGTLSLGGNANNVTGKVRMDSGTLLLNKSGAGNHAVETELTQTAGLTQITGSNDDQIGGNAAVTIHGGTLDLNGHNEGIAQLLGLGGTITNNAPATTSLLTIGDTALAGSSIYYGTIKDGAGAVALTKNTVNGLVLAGNNTYSGTTTISSGNLQLGVGGTTGSIGGGNIVTSANTNFIIDRSDSYSLTNTISGAGRYVQNNGTVTMSATNSYTGSTTVNDGDLLVTGSISGSATTVNEGGLLGGTGLTGAVAIGFGGELSPGINGIGTLSTGSVNFLDGSTFSIDIGSGGSDQIASSGSGIINGSVNLSLTLSAGSLAGNIYTIFNGTSLFMGYGGGARFSYAGNLLDEGELFHATSGAFAQDFTISYVADGGNDVILTAVPEPGSAALLLGGLAMIAGRRRRK